MQCPECGSTRTWRDGLRYNHTKDTTQRWLCRTCGYRFSEPQIKVNVAVQTSKLFHPSPDLAKQMVGGGKTPIKESLDSSFLLRSKNVRSQGSKPQVITKVGKSLNLLPHYSSDCRVCASEAKAAKNLVKVEETILNQVAGADRDIKGKILEYAWKLKKRGLAPSTIKGRIYKLRQLVREGADLMTPNTISTVLALSNWTESNKKAYIITYKSFVKTFHLSWIPPKTRAQRKLPFIPTEAEIDQLIAACGKKTAAFLQVLKETGARSCEASKLKWIDVDEKSCTIRINNPAKGSLPRMVKVRPKTIVMINALPRTGDYIFNPNSHTTYTVFAKMRDRLAKKIQNPRIKQIHFHTLRHWKATMEYHKTKNILYVKQLLGHKKLENTEIYTHLINFESDEWHVTTAKNLEEEKKLIEAGFEYVRYSDRDEVAIYRKRK